MARQGHIKSVLSCRTLARVQLLISSPLSQRKRALLCGRGLKIKAAQLRFQDLVAEAESVRGCFPSALCWPFRSYVVDNRRLRRVVVVAEARLARASTSQDEHFASLFLLVSKADVGGHGVRRKLRCSCRSSDWDGTCPVHTLRSQGGGITQSSKAAGCQLLFPTVDNSVPPKSAMVAGWQRFSVGGHSGNFPACTCKITWDSKGSRRGFVLR